MHKLITPLAVTACLIASAPCSIMNAEERTNPFMAPYGTVYDIPPFERIIPSDYMEAINAGLSIKKKEIEAIASNPEAPTFDNTILAMEQSGQLLKRVMGVFLHLFETDSNAEMEAIGAQALPLCSQADDEIMMNPRLFARVKKLYDERESLNLTPAQLRDVEETYRNFTRSGALLNDKEKEELKEINLKLTDLFQLFNRNLLNATNEFELVVTDPAQLSGLPASNIAVAAEEARNRGMKGKWVFTLHAPSRLPLLQYADNRDLRRKMYEGYTSLASSGQYNNQPVINDILKLRARKAALLGYPDFASYMTANVMAKNVDAAENLLLQVFRPAVARAALEVKEMQKIADKEGASIVIAPWDYYYYAEKVRNAKYNLDEGMVREYFAVDSVRKGIFTMAEKLYGVTFSELPDAPKYNPEVKVYDVLDADGSHLAVFMTDYFPRESKRQGAWMGEMTSAFVDPDGTSQRPIVYNVGNFSKPAGDTPSLLTLDEVETMFHEFGHGLHGMLTKARLRSQAGTNTDRDFVELPSQIHEHWALEPELLKTYARHYRTGEIIPDSLITKLQEASTHNQGFVNTELAGAALLDLQFGKLNPDGDVDVAAFEKNVYEELGMPKEIQFRYRSPYFRHIFGSDGYASGYYTYLWAAVLDNDGFDLFKEKGIFDPETAKAFRKYVLEAGGSEDPMELYVKFRGQEPTVDALLRNRGLKAPERPEIKQLKTYTGR